MVLMEYGGVAHSVVHFAFVYRPNAKHTGFWYLTSQGNSMGIARLPSNKVLWKYNFFFYPSERYGEFKAGCK